MSDSTYARRLAAALTALGLLTVTACGSSSDAVRDSTATTAANSIGTTSGNSAVQHWPCLAGSGAQPASTGGQNPVPLAVLGNGPNAVVMSNQSNQHLCPWLPFAQTLVTQGFQVVLYDYILGPAEDMTAISAYLRSHGATAVALVGASEGAKGVIQAGASITPAPQAVIALSAEATLAGGAEVAPYAAELTAPVLFVAAEDDIYQVAQTDRGFYQSSPAAAKQLLIVPGPAHGTQLLDLPAVASSVMLFLQAHDR